MNKFQKIPNCLLNLQKKKLNYLKMVKNLRTYTWHHHQDTGRMQLVDAFLHEKTGHTGGYNIWGKKGEK